MGIKIIKRNGKSLKDKLYIFAIAGGMRTTLRHFLKNIKDNSNLLTVQYPEVQPSDITPRYRGVHRLTKRDDGSEKCVACYMCATACPAGCIEIEAIQRDDGQDEKRPKIFNIDLLECVYCGYCVEACPCDAIRMDTGIFSFTADKREDFVLNKDTLLSHTRKKEFGND